MHRSIERPTCQCCLREPRGFSWDGALVLVPVEIFLASRNLRGPAAPSTKFALTAASLQRSAAKEVASENDASRAGADPSTLRDPMASKRPSVYLPFDCPCWQFRPVASVVSVRLSCRQKVGGSSHEYP